MARGGAPYFSLLAYYLLPMSHNTKFVKSREITMFAGGTRLPIPLERHFHRPFRISALPSLHGRLCIRENVEERRGAAAHFRVALDLDSWQRHGRGRIQKNTGESLGLPSGNLT